MTGFTSGDDTVSKDLLQDFFIDALAGDDNVTLTEAASDFTLKGAGGEDLITLNGDVGGNALIKGGAADDTFDFESAVRGTSIYGGKGADSFYFARTIEGGVVNGDTGADIFEFTGKISEGAVISGGKGDDSLLVSERLTSSTITGGESRDTIDVNENSESAFINTGSDNDVFTVTGKHTSLTAKGGADDDTFDVEGGVTGSGNKFYGGKGEDSINVSSEAKVAVYGDKDDDVIMFDYNGGTGATGTKVSLGASVYGGAGNDSILADKLHTASVLFAKGNSGNDTIQGADADGEETIYGGQGDDLISNAGNDGERFYYGDKGNDSITLVSADASLASSGVGADSITLSTESTDGTEKFHSVIGGAGVDTISVAGVASGAVSTNYLVDKEATRLYYSSQAEFLSNGDVVDLITISAGNTAAAAVISEELTITDSDEFDRIDTTGGGTETGGTANNARDAVTEGLILQTASSVTKGSTIVFDNAASEYIGGVDLSAGTTGNSTIDNSADTTGNTIGILMAGGEGRNTIKGGSGSDVIIGI